MHVYRGRFRKILFNRLLFVGSTNLRLPGQYYDQETGLHYNWHRDYYPAAGRYIQSDPVGLEGDINIYAYVANGPVDRSDPSGLMPAIALPAICVINPQLCIGVGAVTLGVAIWYYYNPPKLVPRDDCEKGKWTCQAHCQCTPFGPRAGEAQWYVYAMGVGSTQAMAADAAMKACKPKCTRFSYPRHCDTDKCWRR